MLLCVYSVGELASLLILLVTMEFKILFQQLQKNWANSENRFFIHQILFKKSMTTFRSSIIMDRHPQKTEALSLKLNDNFLTYCLSLIISSLVYFRFSRSPMWSWKQPTHLALVRNLRHNLYLQQRHIVSQVWTWLLWLYNGNNDCVLKCKLQPVSKEQLNTVIKAIWANCCPTEEPQLIWMIKTGVNKNVAPWCSTVKSNNNIKVSEYLPIRHFVFEDTLRVFQQCAVFVKLSRLLC